MVNPKDHAVATLAHIEMFPESWDQKQWRCDTGMCFAGTYAELHPNMEWADKLDHWSPRVIYNGEYMHVADAVAVDMGLAHDDDSALFRGQNRMKELRAGVKAYLNDEDVDEAVYSVVQ